MKTFHLEIMTPDKELYAGPASTLSVTAADGSLGVLAGHAPLMTILSPGQVIYHLESGEEVKIDNGGGFLFVDRDKASVLLSPS